MSTFQHCPLVCDNIQEIRLETTASVTALLGSCQDVKFGMFDDVINQLSCYSNYTLNLTFCIACRQPATDPPADPPGISCRHRQSAVNDTQSLAPKPSPNLPNS